MMTVALLAEGVDRNTKSFEEHGFVIGSPSSRRAWIEISVPQASQMYTPVALLAEGVDRNKTKQELFRQALTSPSSRRAWIEIR